MYAPMTANQFAQCQFSLLRNVVSPLPRRSRNGLSELRSGGGGGSEFFRNPLICDGGWRRRPEPRGYAIPDRLVIIDHRICVHRHSSIRDISSRLAFLLKRRPRDGTAIASSMIIHCKPRILG